MLTAQIRIILERKLRDAEAFLNSQPPLSSESRRRLDSGESGSNPEAVRRKVTEEFVAVIDEKRIYKNSVETAYPRFRLSDIRDFGRDYIAGRKLHAAELKQADTALRQTIAEFGLTEPRFRTEVKCRIAADALIQHEQTEYAAFYVAAERSLEIRELLDSTRDIPAVSFVDMKAGKDEAECLINHALRWRGLVMVKAVTDALDTCFHTITSSETAERALRSHELYAERYGAAMKAVRNHPLYGTAGDEYAIRNVVLDAVSAGDDPLDALYAKAAFSPA